MMWKRASTFSKVDPGLREAINIAVEIGRADFKDMLVTHSPGGEYNSSYDVKAEKIPVR
jgi:hypothetical protein